MTRNAPPSLGSTAREIWDAWCALRPGGTYVVDGAVICGGTYFHRDGKLFRSFFRTNKAPATYRDATAAEIADLWDALDAGAVQITQHGPNGLCPGWTHGMAPIVHHQATGRPIPGTAAEARLNAAMAERVRAAA